MDQPRKSVTIEMMSSMEPNTIDGRCRGSPRHKGVLVEQTRFPTFGAEQKTSKIPVEKMTPTVDLGRRTTGAHLEHWSTVISVGVRPFRCTDSEASSRGSVDVGRPRPIAKCFFLLLFTYHIYSFGTSLMFTDRPRFAPFHSEPGFRRRTSIEQIYKTQSTASFQSETVLSRPRVTYVPLTDEPP